MDSFAIFFIFFYFTSTFAAEFPKDFPKIGWSIYDPPRNREEILKFNTIRGFPPEWQIANGHHTRDGKFDPDIIVIPPWEIKLMKTDPRYKLLPTSVEEYEWLRARNRTTRDPIPEAKSLPVANQTTTTTSTTTTTPRPQPDVVQATLHSPQAVINKQDMSTSGFLWLYCLIPSIFLVVVITAATIKYAKSFKKVLGVTPNGPDDSMELSAVTVQAEPSRHSESSAASESSESSQHSKVSLDPRHLTNQKPMEGASGYFSELFSANYRGFNVVIKCTKKDGRKDHAKNELKAMQFLASLRRHEHIVHFVGFFQPKQDDLHLVFEHCRFGNLRDFLHDHSPKKGFPFVYQNLFNFTLQMPDLRLYVSQILDAMMYLSSKNIIHGDLAARNILVCDRHLVKVADFGHSHVQVESVNIFDLSKRSPLPVAWMPPEVMDHPWQIFSSKTDVWSFGVLLWEIFTFGAVPYAETSLLLIPQYIKTGQRLPKPDSLGESDAIWYDVMMSTWQVDLKKRPTFEEIYNFLLSNISRYPGSFQN